MTLEVGGAKSSSKADELENESKWNCSRNASLI